MKPKVFIDGEAGTTGLQIRARLHGRTDIDFIRLDDKDRKDSKRREQALNDCDLAILCLPDDAAREAVTLVTNSRVKVLDASSAHRVSAAWVYGLPEMGAEQPHRIAEARRVSNPGCYPTGVVLLLRPLVQNGLIPPAQPISVHAVSGYTGGGKSLIEAFENKMNPKRAPYSWYGLKLEHKHVEEMRLHSGLDQRPIFTPSYGKYRQGIVLQIPLALWALPKSVTGAELHAALTAAYHRSQYVRVAPLAEAQSIETLEPEVLNGTNNVNLYVFSNDRHRQAVLAAVFDNLGKGASGAAVQNLNLMLGLSEVGQLDLSKQVANG
ncbi:MAG TPA: N-acetyl-gamma-glutamyl-phosphate reductase [Burkholderiales bacterium]|nr:N-acetyl-gamma-glutamyl-phosphate reductase [Burkholderiales bacterium]